MPTPTTTSTVADPASLNANERIELHDLRLLAQLNPHPILRFDGQGRLHYTNDAAQHLLQSLPEAEQGAVHERLLATLATIPATTELEIGGRYFQAQAINTVPPSEYRLLYLTETTHQVRTQRLLDDQQTLLEQVLDTTPNTIYVRNADGTLVFENRAVTELRLQSSYLHPTQAQPPTPHQQAEMNSYRTSDLRVLNEGRQVETESFMTLDSGEQRWFRVVKRLLVRPSGERQVLCVGTDITAQRWALRGLEQREKQYRDLVTYSQALIFTHDLSGHLLSVNPAGAELVGIAAPALVGRHLADGTLPAHQPEVYHYLQQVQEQGRHQGVMALLRPDGSTCYVLYHTRLVHEDEQKPYVIGYGQDITERVLAERALRQAKNAAEGAVRARENFLANMSHEIRTPLNGVLGMAAQLARTPLDSRQQEFVTTIRGAGQHLLHVINDVLDMAKISSGKLELESVAFNLCDSMFECLRPLVAQAQEKGLNVEGTRLQTTCDYPWVLGDPHRLNQILMNLVSNAIKFTEPGGQVTIVGKQLSETDTTITVSFSVTDTGIGIAPDKQQAIFENFTQAYADTTRRYGGTGLGLSISRALVEQLGGALTLTSSPGVGSTFAFNLTLPKAPHEQPSQLLVAYDTGELRGRRVLVVEDNEINRTVARLLLEDWGMLVEEAVDGTAGVERVRQDPPYDLILMDIQMPGLNGLDATAGIRALPDPVRAATPVVALTANAFQADRERCLAAGMQACLAKPFEEEGMYHTLVRVLPSATPSYDLTRLRQMARGREEFVLKIIRSFLHNVPGSLAELREATRTGRWQEAAKLTHHIKPSLESLGVRELTTAVSVLEAADTDDLVTLREAAFQLITQTQRVLQELPNELKNKK